MPVQTDGAVRSAWEALFKEYDAAADECPDVGAVVCFDGGFDWESPTILEMSGVGGTAWPVPSPGQEGWRYRPSDVLCTYSSEKFPRWHIWIVAGRPSDRGDQKRGEMADTLKCFDRLCKRTVRLGSVALPVIDTHPQR